MCLSYVILGQFCLARGCQLPIVFAISSALGSISDVLVAEKIEARHPHRADQSGLRALRVSLDCLFLNFLFGGLYALVFVQVGYATLGEVNPQVASELFVAEVPNEIE